MLKLLAVNLLHIQEKIETAARQSGRLPGDITLVAVTKSVSVEIIRHLYELGIRDFGENRPQMLWERAPQLPGDVRWHMIGQVQTNKLRRTLPYIHLLHSLDRMSLAQALQADAAKCLSPIEALIEVNLTGEKAKHGFSAKEVVENFAMLSAIPNVTVSGLMAMAKHDADPQEWRQTFRQLRELRDALAARATNHITLKYLSMGMSDDFELAIEEGATHVRIGSALFEGIHS